MPTYSYRYTPFFCKTCKISQDSIYQDTTVCQKCGRELIRTIIRYKLVEKRFIW